MGKLYLDLEFTNGNYYLADMLEIPLLSEEIGNVFHSYVKILLRTATGAAVNRYYE